MTKVLHRFSIILYSTVILITLLFLSFYGYSYYFTPIEERFFHSLHKLLKPSGSLGHGFGIIGSFFIIFGIVSYMIRKRVKRFSKVGVLKYWLEFHIFMCTLGPILILFHTALKFGGIVSISFWSMVAVFLSGIIGRFIYQQIPRTIQGNELTQEELDSLNLKLSNELMSKSNFNSKILDDLNSAISISYYQKIKASNIFSFLFQDYFDKKKFMRRIKSELKQSEGTKKSKTEIYLLIKNKIKLTRKMGLLKIMQRAFNYWHIIHLPFAIIMIVIMVVHVGITLMFGYKWIF